MLAEQRRTLITAAQAVLGSGVDTSGLATAAKAVLASGGADPPPSVLPHPPIPPLVPLPPPPPSQPRSVLEMPTPTAEKLVTWHRTREEQRTAQMAQQARLETVGWYPGKAEVLIPVEPPLRPGTTRRASVPCEPLLYQVPRQYPG